MIGSASTSQTGVFGLPEQDRTHDCKRLLCDTRSYLLPGGAIHT
jgi:hypothetical protein